jgi:histidyl-tRNA synthetase
MASHSEPIPGFADLFPAECQEWRTVEEAARQVFASYAYGELRTPILERSEVFLHSLGNETDVVQKEMYAFEDRGGRHLALRPEGTAGVMRALANLGVVDGEEHRVYYLGPMFRGERPAAGRRRQFHQIGVECVGRVSPGHDVECLAMLLHFLDSIGITQRTLLLNTRGTAEDREPARLALRDYFAGHLAALCPDCQRRHETNVWRILDCKVPTCQPIIVAAPDTAALLGQPSRDYFAQVCAGLDALGIPYQVEKRLVRGLDYYCHTVFEVIAEGLGAQNTLAGGGRYEIQPPGGKRSLAGVGFAAGVERLLLVRAHLGCQTPPARLVSCYLVSLGAAAQAHQVRLAQTLRQAGIPVMLDLEGRGMKAQMKAANRCQARYALILGDNELTAGQMLVRDLDSGVQQTLPLTGVLEWAKAGYPAPVA